MKNSFILSKQFLKNFPLSQNEEFYNTFKDYVKYSNQVLSSQIEKNEQIISNLSTFLSFISSLPVAMNSEILSILSHSSQENYDFELRPASSLGKVFCKSKYFTIEFEMSPVGNRTLWDYEKIPIEIRFYTAEEKPQEIISNMMGKDFARVKDDVQLVFKNTHGKYMGKAKMQVTEVSSHYPGGTVVLVVKVKGENEFRIKPLVMSEIVIKAKEQNTRLRE